MKRPSAAVLRFTAMDLERSVLPWLRGESEINAARIPQLADPGYLRGQREARGLSLRTLGERVGVSGAQLSRLEADPPTRNPSPDFVLAFSEALSLDPRQVLDRLGFVCVTTHDQLQALEDTTDAKLTPHTAFILAVGGAEVLRACRYLGDDALATAFDAAVLTHNTPARPILGVELVWWEGDARRASLRFELSDPRGGQVLAGPGGHSGTYTACGELPPRPGMELVVVLWFEPGFGADQDTAVAPARETQRARHIARVQAHGCVVLASPRSQP